jgi:uncharacterized membrane protein YbjE (DUF340 family)
MPPPDSAAARFRRMLAWIVLAAVLMVAAALAFLASQGTLTIHMVVATIAGTFISVLLGCGLFALAFFSDRSGHDQSVSDATRPGDEGQDKPH